jgi:hypothetical protein
MCRNGASTVAIAGDIEPSFSCFEFKRNPLMIIVEQRCFEFQYVAELWGIAQVSTPVSSGPYSDGVSGLVRELKTARRGPALPGEKCKVALTVF